MLIDLIKEFALLCDRDGVLKNFDKTVKNMHPDYEALRSSIAADTTVPILPELTDFVFGLDPDAANEHMRNVKGPFMLLDYGLFRGSNIFATGGSNIDFMFSCIIAMPGNKRKLDPIEDALWRNTLLAYAKRMLKHFEQRDKNTCAVNRMLNGNFTITPVDPMILLNCIGWDVSFTKNGSAFLF